MQSEASTPVGALLHLAKGKYQLCIAAWMARTT
jgi:hypothetical protein